MTASVLFCHRVYFQSTLSSLCSSGISVFSRVFFLWRPCCCSSIIWQRSERMPTKSANSSASHSLPWCPEWECGRSTKHTAHNTNEHRVNKSEQTRCVTLHQSWANSLCLCVHKFHSEASVFYIMWECECKTLMNVVQLTALKQAQCWVSPSFPSLPVTLNVFVSQTAFEVLSFVSVLSNCWLLLLSPQLQRFSQEGGISSTNMVLLAVLMEVKQMI